MRSFVSIAFLGACLIEAKNTHYYVDCSAANAGNGSINSPFNSKDDFELILLEPGDKVFFKEDVVCEGPFELRGSGSNEDYLTIMSYGPKGSKGIIDGKGGMAALRVMDASWLLVESLKLTNSASSNNQMRAGLILHGADNENHSNIEIRDMEIYDVAGITEEMSPFYMYSGGIIYIAYSAVGKADSVYIHRNQLTNCSGGGIKFYGGSTDQDLSTNVVISENIIVNAVGDGISVGNLEDPVISSNSITQNDNVPHTWISGTYFGIRVFDSSNPVIQTNAVANLKDGGQAYCCDHGVKGNCTVQYNYAQDVTGGFFAEHDGDMWRGTEPETVIRYNIAERACDVYSTAASNSKMFFYNNDLYCPESAINFVPTATSEAVNNIIVGSRDTKLPSGENHSWNANIFNGFEPPAGSTHNMMADPRFENPGNSNGTWAAGSNYRLALAAPGRQSGISVPNNGGLDYFGYQLPKEGVNRGAFQGPKV